MEAADLDQAGPGQLLEHLGLRALSWLLNTDPERVLLRADPDSAEQLEPAAEIVLASLLRFDRTPTSPTDVVSMQWRHVLGSREDGSGESFGNIWRRLSGGEVATAPAGLTVLEEALARLTIETYPAMLVELPSVWANIGIGASLYSDPLAKQFQDAVRVDAVLGALFTEDSEPAGPAGSTIRSSGQGSGHQLWTFAETLIGAGWRLARSVHLAPSTDEVVAAVLQSLTTVRAALTGEAVVVPARVGLAGVLLPDGVESLNFEWGRMRHSDGRDQFPAAFARPEGQLTTTTPAGRSVVINYSGDLVLEVEVPYLVRIGSLDPSQPWPREFAEASESVDRLVQNVRIGLLLAVSERPTVITPAWQTVLDPLTSGHSGAFWDVARTPGLVPTQLSEEEAEAWQEWSSQVGKYRTQSIDVALRRILMATSGRPSAEDVLVDAVVAWENLFGAGTETTLRVTSSLAWLLGRSPEDRMTRQAHYKKIYEARSRLVHGAASVKPEQVQLFSQEAVRIAIEALRALFGTDQHLLAIPTSEARSLHVLHYGAASPVG